MSTMKMEWDGHKLVYSVGFASLEEVKNFLEGTIGPALKKFGYKVTISPDEGAKDEDNRKVTKQ